MKIAVIGGGVAGLTCAAHLVEKRHSVVVYDKGRIPGGRVSARRIATASGNVCLDYGAQYFTARDDVFRAQVNRWESAGLVTPWPAAGADAWIGLPAMNAPALALAADLEVHASARVVSIRRDQNGWHLAGDNLAAGPFEAVVVALPAEQTSTLIAPVSEMPNVAADIVSGPCWTVMAVFENRLPIAEDVIRQSGILDWAARNAAKPGRLGPEAWVMHATPEWSSDHLEMSADHIGPHLLAALAATSGGDHPSPVFLKAHRWRYARSGRLGCAAVWNAKQQLGLCGDWLLGPRLECAWLSGRALAEQIGTG